MDQSAHTQILVYTFTVTLLTLSPGADTMLVIRNVIRGGRKQGWVTAGGICSGLFVHAILSALGISMILMHSATMFQGVKYAGALYLVWLGYGSIRRAAKASPQPAPNAGRQPHPVHHKQCFIEGFLTNLLNPKVAVFYLAFLPQFITPADAVMTKSLVLAGIHFLLGMVWLSILSVLLDKSRDYARRPMIRRSLDAICGTVLIGFGIKLALEKA